MSRRQFQPSDQQRTQVLTMTGYGVQQDQIARLLQIDAKTLRRHFRRELDIGMTEANVRVAHALFTNAVKLNNVAAQIWWTKARMGWKEATDLNVGGTGTPLSVDFRWADAMPSAAPPVSDPPTIDAEAAGGEDAETEAPGSALTVTWNTGSS